MGQPRLAGFLLIVSVLWLPSAWAGTGVNPETSRTDLCLTVEEEDQSPSNQGCLPVRVTNGTLTDNTTYYSLSTGGGGGNSFETIAVPAGTNPVADSSTDTLTITESTFLTITGTAATDTIAITQVTTDIGTDGLIAADAVALTTDTTGNYVADVTAGVGLTKTSSAGEGQTVDLAVGAGTYIDVNADDVAVDATEILDVTFAAGANASQVWTWALSGTNPQVTFGSDALTLNAEDLTVQGAGPNLVLDPDSGDSFGFHVDPNVSTGFINNSTDNIHYLHFGSGHQIDIGGGVSGAAKVPFVRISTDGTGNDELILPVDSVGADELDTADAPADGEFLAYQSSSGRMVWSTSAGSGDITSVGDVTSGAAFDGTQGTTFTFNDAAGDQTLLYNSGGDLDFNFSDDVNIRDATPHLQLIDTTGNEDDLEWWADAGQVGLSNVTDSRQLAVFSEGSTFSHTPSTDALRTRTAGMFCGGTLSTAMDCEDGKTRIPAACTVLRVDLQVSQAPTTQAIIVDPNLCDSSGGNCVTIDSGTKPQIAVGATSGFDTAFTTTTLTQGGFLQFDLDQVGSGTVGADLTVSVTCVF